MSALVEKPELFESIETFCQESFVAAQALNLTPLVKRTELTSLPNISKRLNTAITLKREDQQSVFSFKIRGAFAKMQELTPEQQALGVICASASLLLRLR